MLLGGLWMVGRRSVYGRWL